MARTCRWDRKRMSNCVVGSGGSWLPCSTIAEHSVEGCDHFSHDGDDDDLGFFVGGGEAVVGGFGGGAGKAWAGGGHVEDGPDGLRAPQEQRGSLKFPPSESEASRTEKGATTVGLSVPQSGTEA